MLFCPACRDAFSLTPRSRSCFCGKNHGRRTEDGKTVEVSSGAVIMGIPDPAIDGAIEHLPEQGRGVMVSTWVLPKLCATVRRIA